MRDRSARALEFAARMQKRRRSTVAAGGPRGTGESSAAEAERLKAKAVSLLASLEVCFSSPNWKNLPARVR